MLLKLQAHPELRAIRELADSLGFDVAGTHRSIGRLRAVGLFDVPAASAVPLGAAEEFLISAVKFVFPAVRGGELRGVPTSWAAAPLRDHISPLASRPPVWPDSAGSITGVALSPLHSIVVTAANADEPVRRRLTLVDALRDAPSASVRATAARLLRAELRERPSEVA